MKLFTFLIVSAVAIHSCSGTFSLAKSIVERNVQTADALVKKVLNSGSNAHETYDIHIQRQPLCEDCVRKLNTEHVVKPARQVVPAKGRYFYYPTSYYYPSTAYYYYPSYAVAALPQKQTAQRRVGVFGTGQVYNHPHGYLIYPTAYLPKQENLKQVYGNPVQVNPEYYQPEYQPYASHSPVPVSVYPPFSKLIRQKSGRPVVLPLHRRPGFGGLKDAGTTDPVKGGNTTEAPVEQQQQEQEQEQEPITEDPTPVKGYYSIHHF